MFLCLSWRWVFGGVHGLDTLVVYFYLGLNTFFSSRQLHPFLRAQHFSKALLITDRKNNPDYWQRLLSVVDFLKMSFLGHKCHGSRCASKSFSMHIHLFFSFIMPYLQNTESPFREGTRSLYVWHPQRIWHRNGRCSVNVYWFLEFRRRVMVDMIICLNVASSW